MADYPLLFNYRNPDWYTGPGIYRITRLDPSLPPIDIPFNQKVAVTPGYYDENEVFCRHNGDTMIAELIVEAIKLPDTPTEFLLEIGDPSVGHKFVHMMLWRDILNHHMISAFPNDVGRINLIQRWLDLPRVDEITTRNRIRECDEYVHTHVVETPTFPASLVPKIDEPMKGDPKWYKGVGIYRIDELKDEVPLMANPYHRIVAIIPNRSYDFVVITRCNITLRAEIDITRATRLPDYFPTRFILDTGVPFEGQQFLKIRYWQGVMCSRMRKAYPQDVVIKLIKDWLELQGTDEVILRRIHECRDYIALRTDPKFASLRQLATNYRNVGAEGVWEIHKSILPRILHRKYDRFVTRTDFTAR